MVQSGMYVCVCIYVCYVCVWSVYVCSVCVLCMWMGGVEYAFVWCLKYV